MKMPRTLEEIITMSKDQKLLRELLEARDTLRDSVYSEPLAHSLKTPRDNCGIHFHKNWVNQYLSEFKSALSTLKKVLDKHPDIEFADRALLEEVYEYFEKEVIPYRRGLNNQICLMSYTSITEESIPIVLYPSGSISYLPGPDLYSISDEESGQVYIHNVRTGKVTDNSSMGYCIGLAVSYSLRTMAERWWKNANRLIQEM